MKNALRSIQQTDAGRWMLVPRLTAGLPLLVAGAAHYVRPSLLLATLTAAAAPVRDLLRRRCRLSPSSRASCDCSAISAGWGHSSPCRFRWLVSMAPVKLYELPAIDARTASLMPPLAMPLVVTLSAFAALGLGSGALSLDAEDTQTTFDEADDLYTEFEFLGPESSSDFEPGRTPEVVGV